MIARTIALVFFGAAVVAGFALGWNRDLGSVLLRVNASGVSGFQTWVERYLRPEIWDGLFAPMMAMPAWGLPLGLGLIALLAGVLRPGRG